MIVKSRIIHCYQKILLTSVIILLFMSGASATKIYSDGAPISVTIGSPANNSLVAAGASVTCYGTASDTDHWVWKTNQGNDSDAINPNSYTWTSGAGTWLNGINTGQTVTWIAPTFPCTCSLSLSADDVPLAGAGDRNDGAASVSINVSIVKITQSEDLWWFNGAHPSNYALEVTLTAEGVTQGTFYWNISQGFDKAGIVDGENLVQSITRSNSNTVTLRSKAASVDPNDVHIQFSLNGISITTYSLDVKSPHHMAHMYDIDSSLWDGYLSEIHYGIIDQFGDVLPETVSINESWISPHTSDPSNPNEDWEQPNAQGWDANPSNMKDDMAVTGNPRVPLCQNPASPLGSVKIDSWGQRWSIGSQTIGAGKAVHDNKHQRYQDHGRHE
jgi:hypothetical protein